MPQEGFSVTNCLAIRDLILLKTKFSHYAPDEAQLKNGCSIIIDPFGEIIAECRTPGNDIVIAEIIPDKLINAGGYR